MKSDLNINRTLIHMFVMYASYFATFIVLSLLIRYNLFAIEFSILASAIWIYILVYRYNYNIKRVLSYDYVDGEVLKIDSIIVGCMGMKRPKPRIKYRYYYNDTKYINDSWGVDDCAINYSIEEVKSFLSKFKKHDIIKIWVNPNNPQISYIHKEDFKKLRRSYIMFILVVVFPLCGYAFYLA